MLYQNVCLGPQNRFVIIIMKRNVIIILKETDYYHFAKTLVLTDPPIVENFSEIYQISFRGAFGAAFIYTI